MKITEEHIDAMGSPWAESRSTVPTTSRKSSCALRWSSRPRRPPRAERPLCVPAGPKPWQVEPASFIHGTWTELRQAAEWFGGQLRATATSFVSEHDSHAARTACGRTFLALRRCQRTWLRWPDERIESTDRT